MTTPLTTDCKHGIENCDDCFDTLREELKREEELSARILEDELLKERRKGQGTYFEMRMLEARRDLAEARAEAAALREERDALAYERGIALDQVNRDGIWMNAARALLARLVGVRIHDRLDRNCCLDHDTLDDTRAFLARDEARRCTICGTPVEADGLCHRTHLYDPPRDEAPRGPCGVCGCMGADSGEPCKCGVECTCSSPYTATKLNDHEETCPMRDEARGAWVEHPCDCGDDSCEGIQAKWVPRARRGRAP